MDEAPLARSLSLVRAQLTERTSAAAFLPLPDGSPWYAATLVLAVVVQEVVRVAMWYAYKDGSKQLEVLARRMVRPEPKPDTNRTIRV
jgi:hypothetical protein